MLRTRLYLFLLFIVVNQLFSQEPYAYQLTHLKGLPSNEVYQVIQDKKGFIWIGCDAGLFRFDGMNYEPFRTIHQNGRSISGLQISRNGILWCRNFYGQIYAVVNNQLKLIHSSNENRSSSGFAIDLKNQCWFVERGKLICKDITSKLVHQFILPKDYANALPTDIKHHSSSIYIAFSDKSPIVFNIAKKQFKVITLSTSVNPSSPFRSGFIEMENSVELLIELPSSKRYEIHQIKNNSTKKKIELYSDKGVQLYKAYFKQGKYSFCTSSGLFTSKVTSINMDHQKMLFGGNKISSSIVDTEGINWYSSLTNGIFVVPDQQFSVFSTSNSTITSNAIAQLFAIESNQLLLAYNAGNLAWYNWLTNKHIPLSVESETKLLTPKQVHQFGNQLWIAHGPLSQIKGFITKTLPFYNNRDFCIYQDTVWSVTADYVLKIPIKQLNEGKKNALKIAFKQGGKACFVWNNKLIFLLNEGIFTYQNGILKPFPIKNHHLYVSSITAFHGDLFIGTLAQGLFVVDKNFTIKKIPLCQREILNVYSTNQHVWVVTNDGLIRINRHKKITANFNHLFGIYSTDIKSISESEAWVYLATNDGMIRFPSAYQWKSNYRPKLYVNGIHIGHSSVTNYSRIEVPFQHKYIQIDTKALSYKSQDKLILAYRIRQLDEEWIKVQANQKPLILSKLPAGNYQIELKAIDFTENASEIIEISLIIHPPIWQTWWFYLILSLIIIAIISWIAYSRINYIRKKEQQEKQLITSELTALKAQMNPHFMFNALNSIQELVLEGDIKNSTKYLGKFSKLMRQILDNSGKSKITLKEEIELLELYLSLEQLRFGNEFSYTILVNFKFDQEQLELPPMLLQPYIENALKHGLLHKKGSKMLQIEFDLIDHQLVCKITDNGVGRKRSAEINNRQRRQHQSFASDATEKRLDLLSQINDSLYAVEIVDLYTENEATGTLVNIQISI